MSPLVAKAIESLFTPASGLETSIIDESVERRLTQLSDQVRQTRHFSFFFQPFFESNKSKKKTNKQTNTTNKI